MEITSKIMILTATHIALSACGAIPTAVETDSAAPRSAEAPPNPTQVNADAGGLGTISYGETVRVKPCEKMRRTGSHLYISKCDDPDSGSQPVRYGTWNDLGRLAMSGSVRPEN